MHIDSTNVRRLLFIDSCYIPDMFLHIIAHVIDSFAVAQVAGSLTRVRHDGLVREVTHQVRQYLLRILRLICEPWPQPETPHLQQKQATSLV